MMTRLVWDGVATLVCIDISTTRLRSNFKEADVTDDILEDHKDQVAESVAAYGDWVKESKDWPASQRARYVEHVTASV